MNTDQHSFPAAAPVRPTEASRRAFLRDCIRYPILAGLAVVGGMLALRKGDPNFIEPCLKQRVCRDCGLFRDCAKPQAAAARKNNL